MKLFWTLISTSIDHSVDFARLILQQMYYLPAEKALFKKGAGRILELGAGTGILGVLLSPFFKHYTMTDTEQLLPLIRKNVGTNYPGWSPRENNFNVSVEPLNWMTFAEMSPALRSQYVASLPAFDLVVAVDCTYNPSLLPALLSTIEGLSKPTLVIAELRDEEVTRNFLVQWLEMEWKVMRLGREGALNRPYVMWLGWKPSTMGAEPWAP